MISLAIQDYYLRVNQSRLKCPIVHLHGHLDLDLFNLSLTSSNGIFDRVRPALKYEKL